MARHHLSAREVQTAAIGDHPDGDGLFLRVQPGVDRLRASWVLRYTSCHPFSVSGAGDSKMAQWEQIPIDQMLDAEHEGDHYLSAKYERILEYRSTLAVQELSQKVVGLMQAIQRVGQLVQEKVDELREDSRKAAEAQARQQRAIQWLTGVIAAATVLYTAVTVATAWSTFHGAASQRQAIESPKSKS